MKKILLILVFVFIAVTLGPFGATPKKGNERLEFVRTISEQGDFFFSRIADASMTSGKDIFIVDSKGPTVSKFTWEGKLVKKIGRHGKGPGDFAWPESICIHNDHVYVMDMFNGRLMKADLSLENLDYIKLPNGKIVKDFKIINSNRLIISHYASKEPTDNKISLIDEKGDIEKSFFNHTPYDMRTKNPRMKQKMLFLTRTTYALDEDSKMMLVGFNTFHNPFVLYLYDLDGKLHKTFKYQMDKKYKLRPDYLTNTSTSFNKYKGHHSCDIDGIFHFDNHWYVFLNTRYYKNGDYELTVRNHLQYVEWTSFYLKIDESLKLVGKYDVEPYFRSFYISKDGYVLGKHPESDAEDLTIYKIVK